ncbi:ABC-type multidrug transport system, ATPase component [Actinacidiphila glaucinigra]|uniref:ABC-type xenobiotic transporter n=2 Tax=Actinacidiphila glaucinigra TaxID=235986 RepID=A0A239MW56_9ACTN|nr:ABC-type multidrug transport system, ATPase component [Actinacidiphila glaucinigra]
MRAPGMPESRPRRRPDLLVGPAVLRGAAELHPVKDPVNGRRFELRAKEFFVLDHLDGERTLAEVGDAYAGRFGARLGEAQWRQLLGLLYGRGLLAGAEGAAQAGSPGASGPRPKGALSGRSTVLSGHVRMVSDAGALIEHLHRRTAFARTPFFLGTVLLLVCAMMIHLAAEFGTLVDDMNQLAHQPVLLMAAGVGLWVSMALHELAHGLVGRAFGGTVTEIGLRWRLPVTYMYCLVQDVPFFARRRHQMATAAAGPAMNLALLLPLWPLWAWAPAGAPHSALGGALLVGLVFALANLAPLPPLDGYKLLGYGLGVERLAAGSRGYLAAAVAGRFGRGPGTGGYPPRARAVYRAYGLAAGALTTGAAALLLLWATRTLAERYGTAGGWAPVLLLLAAVVLWRLGLAARARRLQHTPPDGDEGTRDSAHPPRTAPAVTARPPRGTAGDDHHPAREPREQVMTPVEQAAEAVVIDDVRKSYGDLKAVDGVSLTVRRGEFFGILGPNGAGKTTLIEMVEGLRRADGGSVSVLGSSPWPRNTELLRRLGVQTQASAFFTRLSALEHLRTVATLYGLGPEAADRALREVGLGEQGGTRVDDLSGGQRQRLAIATALVHEPELIMLDEPTAALDPEARRSLWSLLRGLKSQGRTIVHTTHHLDEAEALCDRVAIMSHGRVIALDTPANLVRSLKAPTRVLVPADRITVERALAIDGVDRAEVDNGEVVMETRVAGQVIVAVNEIAGPDAVQTRTATLEDAYLALTGSEH